MRAVNLIPGDSGRGRGGAAMLSQGPAYLVLGALAAALVLVTIYVLTGNTIATRKAKLADLQQQLVQARADAARLSNYVQFEQLAQARSETVRQIAATRFDWHAALSDLSKVIPANASVQSLLGTVAPGANVSGAGGSTAGSAAATGTLRAAISVPAFELKGCAQTQDDVARLMSRLRLINGVTRVTLADSQKQDSAAGAAGAKGNSTGACAANTPGFDLVVFFGPLPGAGPSGVTSLRVQATGGAR